METPSSIQITRSQNQAALNDNGNDHISRKGDDYDMSGTKSRKGNVLIDITNDSPIAGVAMETPTSSIVKKRSSRAMRTPGSGEALLRGQVKTLLQKVEEEAELSKISIESCPILSLKALVNSPIGLVAPTPANTPLVGDGDGSINGLSSALPSLVEQFVPQVSVESEKSMITRSLLLDFYEKSDVSADSSEISSVLIYKGISEEDECSGNMPASADDDVSSMWSIQANASAGEEEVGELEDDDYGKEKEEDKEDLIDKACDGVNNLSMD